MTDDTGSKGVSQGMSWYIECQDCDEKLRSFWHVFKHNLLMHTFEGKIIRKVFRNV